MREGHVRGDAHSRPRAREIGGARRADRHRDGGPDEARLAAGSLKVEAVSGEAGVADT